MDTKPNRAMSDKLQDIVNLANAQECLAIAMKNTSNVLLRRVDELNLIDTQKRKDDK